MPKGAKDHLIDCVCVRVSPPKKNPEKVSYFQIPTKQGNSHGGKNPSWVGIPSGPLEVSFFLTVIEHVMFSSVLGLSEGGN